MSDMMANLTAEIGLVAAGDVALPISITSGEPTCYVGCPSVAYIDYARAELGHFTRSPMLLSSLDVVLRIARPLVRASGLDRQAQPNNWLLATNPMPRLSVEAIGSLTRDIAARWPGHAIVWRSLNDISDVDAIANFRSVGYRLLPARQIYLYDCRHAVPRIGRDGQRDLDLLADGRFEIVPPAAIRLDDMARIEQLYRLLYLDKYTWLNPQYTARFMSAMHWARLVQFHGLRRADGVLVGVVGLFDSGDVTTAPIVGYDTSMPPNAGLYRRLMAIAMRRAREKRMLFNMSAGAAGFKRNRGGMPAIEYSTVYDRGLGLRQRAAGALVRGLLTTVGVPLAQEVRIVITPSTWQAVAECRSVRSKPVRIVVDGEPLVLFRTGDSLHCLIDRCPHRFAPLSGGRVIDGQIECPYHGWRFDGSGRCKLMPGMYEDVPMVAVPTRAVIERGGLVFVSRTGNTGEPYLGALSGPDVVTATVESRVCAQLIDVAENILDATHTHFTQQRPPARPVESTLSRAGDRHRRRRLGRSALRGRAEAGGHDQPAARRRTLDQRRALRRDGFSWSRDCRVGVLGS